MLKNIRNYLTGKWNFATITDYVNPCSGCHNPHRAQRDPHTTTGRFVGQKLPGVVSRPLDHSKDNNVWKLWGDDLGERMSDYTTDYQAPCRYPWSNPCTSFEPDGSSTTDGVNLFDTVTFCRDCHANSLPSARLGRNTYAINWDVDQHGKGYDPGYIYEMNYPYTFPTPTRPKNYVLSCLDCHEPHGSPNEYLLRQEVNGVQVNVLNGEPISGEKWYYFCAACHTTPHVGPTFSCGKSTINCHSHGQLF